MPDSPRHLQRSRLWPAVQKVLGALPARQLQQALLLSHNLALVHSDDAQPQNILSRSQDYPLLDQHAWLLGDWALPKHEVFEALAFCAIALSFLALKTKSARLSPHSFFDARYQGLEEALDHHATLHWQQLFPSTSPFWPHYRQAREAAFTKVLASDPLPAIDYWALAPMPAIAVALWAGKEVLIPQLVTLTDHLRVVLQTVGSFANFPEDLQNGLSSYPLNRALGGVPAADAEKLSTEAALATLILSGTTEKIVRECQARLTAARALAIKLGLPSFARHCDRLDALLLQVRQAFSIKTASAGIERPPMRGFFAPARNVLDNVLQKAESYLLADPGMREAWDVQQNTSPQLPQLIGQPFPASLAIEILCHHGHALAEPVEIVLEACQRNGFRYYDVVEILVPDADVLALATRLIPYACEPEKWQAVFATPLRWMRENQMPSGQIPVWFRHNDSPQPLSELSLLYGSSCATVETNLLLGLIDYDWPGYRELIEGCARSWCERWLALGLGCTEHYTPLYSLWAGMELATKLKERLDDGPLREQLGLVAAYLVERLGQEANEPDLGPQDAAFLTLASLRTKALPFNPAWITLMFKHQRWDGCWEGAPVYVVPSARGLSTLWFTSRTVTTAFCYHALKHYHSHLHEH